MYLPIDGNCSSFTLAMRMSWLGWCSRRFVNFFSSSPEFKSRLGGFFVNREKQLFAMNPGPNLKYRALKFYPCIDWSYLKNIYPVVNFDQLWDARHTRISCHDT